MLDYRVIVGLFSLITFLLGYMFGVNNGNKPESTDNPSQSFLLLAAWVLFVLIILQSYYMHIKNLL